MHLLEFQPVTFRLVLIGPFSTPYTTVFLFKKAIVQETTVPIIRKKKGLCYFENSNII